MRQYLSAYKPYFPASFFLGGFLFDLVTLMRIDENLQLAQQFAYLVIIGLLLWAEKSQRVERWFSSGFLNKVWIYRYEVIHFLLGSLLSIYTIFYFKSASIWNAFFFIGGLSALLVLNEFERIKGLDDTLRFSLFSLCCCSYFIYLVPIIWQHIGLFTFLFSLVLSAVFYVCFFYLLSKYEHITTSHLTNRVLLPGVVVHVLFLLLYVFRFLPPVPLSAEKMGIYHDIKKVGGEYHLFYERPWWKIWQRGAQTFVAGPNDKVYCFASIFAPNFFTEQVTMEWWFKERNGWKRTDAIPISISGGRDQGFRGHTVKSALIDGEWQVRVMTSDAREISRIYFSVRKDLALAGHEFEVDIF